MKQKLSMFIILHAFNECQLSLMCSSYAVAFSKHSEMHSQSTHTVLGWWLPELQSLPILVTVACELLC